MALGDYAYNRYGQSTLTGVNEVIPRSKYNFSVSMIHKNDNPSAGIITSKFDLISSISMPSYSVKSNTLNQYNKKRVVQTGIEYAPITLLAYDDRSGDLEKFLKNYSEYYYSGSMNYGNTLAEFNKISAGTKLQEEKNFINQLTITRVNSTKDKNVINVFNPMITNIDADTLDYSDSGLVQYRITFIYEGFSIDSNQ